jgi:nitroreductase
MTSGWEFNMNLYEAIFVRKTVRKFKMNPIEQSRIDDIISFAQNLPMLFQDIAVEYKVLDKAQVSHMFSGAYTVHAPHYLVIASETAPNYLMNAGYLMQQISLYLTAKGLGSCYLGSMKPKKEFGEVIQLKYVIMLAFGESEHEIYRPSDKSRRLPLEDIVVYKTEASRNILTMIQAGRLAPSSMNSQPWRFVVYDNRIHIFCKKNIFLSGVLNELKMIDIGICLAHLLVTSEELWIDVKALRLDNISNISFKKNDYVISLKMY